MIKRFQEIKGRYIEKINGQDRLAYCHSETNDFCDLFERTKDGGYPGSVISFYDFETGKVYTPFEKKRNTLYSNPVYAEGYYYFLQGDYDRKKVILYRFRPEKELETVVELNTDDVNLYNLYLLGDPVYVVSQGERFECYYPDRISFPKEPNESASLIKDGYIYFDAWVEEGWDEEKWQATEDYRLYNKIVIRDFEGNLISEELGALYQAADDTWWIT